MSIAVASLKGYPSTSLGFLDPTHLNARLDLLRVLLSGSQPEVRSAATTTSWPQRLTGVHFCGTADLDALREIWSRTMTPLSCPVNCLPQGS